MSGTHSESIIGCLVLTDAVNKLAVTPARDFAGRIRRGIPRLAEGFICVECQLQMLVLLARVCWDRR